MIPDLHPRRAWHTEHRMLWWAIGVGLLARVIILLTFAPWRADVESATVLVNDAGVYHRLALCLLQSEGLCLNTNRTPGYPGFVAAIYSLASAQPWVVLAVQALVDALTVALTYALGIRLFTPVVAAAAALLLALDPTTLFASSSLLTDSLFTLLFLSAVSLFLLGMGSAQHRWAIAAGLALGLAAWVRPSAQYVPALLFATTLCRGAWPWRHRLAFGATLMIAFMLTIAPWLYRNHQQFGALALATVKSDTLLNWHAAFFIAWRDHKPVDEVRQDLDKEIRASGWVDDGNPFENGMVQERVALRHIRAQPVAYAQAMLRGMVFMYAGVGTETIARKLQLVEPAATRVNLRNEPTMRGVVERALRDKGPERLALGALLAAVNVSQYLLALIGCWICLRSGRHRSVVLFFLLLTAYFTLTSGVSAEPRYKMPVTPLYLLLAGVAVQAWVDRRAR